MTVTVESVEALKVRSNRYLTSKESEFLDSLQARLQTGRSLTFGQKRWFNDLELKYSEESLALEVLWMNSFDADKRLTARRVADYYRANPPYYSHYVARIDEDPEGFMLSKKEWHKFCENKYALKIRKEYEGELKFKVGDIVQIRKTNKISKANYPRSLSPLGDKTAFVVKTDALPVTRAARGSRVYKILLVGSTTALNVHESDIKKGRSKLNV